MDSAALLDLLGNENRRRILRLLSQKPCYVTEISEYLRVSPKAVIDHLRKLEAAGLVESRTDENRRKYFYISQNLRLEVNVSQYSFGTKSAYPASSSLDLTSCEYLSLQMGSTDSGTSADSADSEPSVDSTDSGSETDDIAALATDLDRLKRVENELSLAQRWVQGRLIETLDRLTGALEANTDGTANGRLYIEVLAALANGSTTVDQISDRTDAPVSVVEEALESLSAHGIVSRSGTRWTLEE